MLTPWGYSVESLPPLLTADQFNAITGGRYAGDERLDAAIAAASAAIRAWCGWHVAPILTCEYVCDGQRGDIWLPCAGLRSVDSVEFAGAAQEVLGFNRLGRVRTASAQPCGLGNVSVTYSAGYDVDAAPDLADVVAQRVVAAVAMTAYGIASESAGGVSISYSTAAQADAGAGYVPESARAALMPYRLVSAHVA